MKKAWYMFIGLICLQWLCLNTSAATEKDERVVTVSTLCLLDDPSSHTRDTIVGMINQAGRRQDHDLIVVPLTPFITFREGYEKLLT